MFAQRKRTQRRIRKWHILLQLHAVWAGFFLPAHLCGYQGGLRGLGPLFKFSAVPARSGNISSCPHLHQRRLLRLKGKDGREHALFGRRSPNLWTMKWFCFHRWRGNLELNQIGFLWFSPYIVRGLGLLVLFLNKNLIIKFKTKNLGTDIYQKKRCFLSSMQVSL